MLSGSSPPVRHRRFAAPIRPPVCLAEAQMLRRSAVDRIVASKQQAREIRIRPHSRPIDGIDEPCDGILRGRRSVSSRPQEQASPRMLQPRADLRPHADIHRDRPATFLFLQGLASPFFADLGLALKARGHNVRRINFSSGDWLFWRLPADNYRGSFADWGDYVAAYIRQH